MVALEMSTQACRNCISSLESCRAKTYAYVPSTSEASSSLNDGLNENKGFSKDSTSPKQRYRRCMVEIIVGHLGTLGREARREIITRKLSQQQRLAIEQFISTHKLKIAGSLGTDASPTYPSWRFVVKHATLPRGDCMFHRRYASHGLVEANKCAKLKSSSIPRTAMDRFSHLNSCRKLPRARIAADSLSLDESEDIVHISSHIKAGVKFYYAMMGIDSLVFRCKSRTSIDEATEHQTSLRKIKQRITSRIEDFEARVIGAVSEVERDRITKGLSDWGLTVSVRVAATWWVGQDLTTPARTSRDIGSVLSEWRKFREIRGRPRKGGRGILYHHSLHAISSMWAQLRQAYLNICGSKGVNIKKLSAKLDAKVAQRESHRRTQLQQWGSMQHRRLQSQQRRESRRANIDARRELRLQKKQSRVQNIRVARETASLRALERLIAKWSPRSSRMKPSTIS